MPETIVVKLPEYFWFDHVGRGGEGELVARWSRRYVKVRLDEAQFRHLMEDARVYAYMQESERRGMRGLSMSARATLRALWRVETPW